MTNALVRDPRQVVADDAEVMVLSAMLNDAGAVRHARDVLVPRHFATKPNREIFAAALAVEGEVDPITVADELARRGVLDEAGGIDTLYRLATASPTAANVEYHAKIVLEHAERRRLAQIGTDFLRNVQSGQTPTHEIAANFMALLDTVGHGDRRQFPVVSVLEGDAPPPLAMLVRDLIIDGDINMWAGFGGSAKSALACVLAIGVVLGRPVFGSLSVQRSGPVLIVAPEDGQAAVRMMVDAIIAGLGLGKEDRTLLEKQLVMIPDECSVNLMVDTAKLAETARATGAVLVVFDPLRDLLGGAEILDNTVSNAALKAIRRDLCRGAGVAVLINTHNRKPDRTAGATATASRHEMLGAGGWADGSRLVFSVSKKGDDLTLACTKANRLRADTRHELRLTIDADPANKAHWRSCVIGDRNAGAASDSLTPGIGRALNENERSALTGIDDKHEPGKRFSWSGWRDGSGLNENTWKSIKTKLIDAGLAIASTTGKKTRSGDPEYAYGITADGRNAPASGWIRERLSGEGVTSGE